MSLRKKSVLIILLIGASLGSIYAQKIEPKVLSDLRTQGQTTFYLKLSEQADTSPAQAITDWQAKGEYVVETLQAVAQRTQRPLLEWLAKKAGTKVESFWVVNLIQVTTGDATLIQELAGRTDVAALIAENMWAIPEPIREADKPRTQTVEWNISRVNADQVWDQFNNRGEGIVVGHIDSGVQFDHPALVMKYRGRQDDGSFDHNYNWYDPLNQCPRPEPCDTDRAFGGHGTHTMGTMIGDDGQGNQIGVAPGAKWITAKGCGGPECNGTALTRSGQWMLAPTDLNGQNPRPDLRPHVVNNSWGGGGPFYRDIVQNWRNAGIVPVFASGNPGPQCGRANYPSVWPEAFGVGATAINDTIASFSGRGPAPDGNIKPNASAPGVSIRSSLRGDRYGFISGTSMAAPHVAGVVALLWKANPALVGDVDTTVDVLQTTADFKSSTQCGDAGPPNNVFGWGIVDALAGVQMVTLSEPGPSK